MDNRAITFNIPGTHSQIVLEVCNLFEQEGAKVVHCHHTFDTDAEVMLETSVMGQFITLCKEKGFDLDAEIDRWIERHKENGLVIDSLPCRKRIFNLGSTCQLKVDGELYMLSAFEDLSVFLETGAMEMNAYLNFLDNLWDSLVKSGIEKTTLNIPAFGNKIVNISNNGFTIDQKIGLIVQSYFKALKSHRLFETLRICIHESDAKKMDLDKWEKVLCPYLYQFCQLPLGVQTLYPKQKGLFSGIKKTVRSYPGCMNAEGAEMPKQIFISHSTKDDDAADQVCEHLESVGYKCWIDHRDLTPGIPYAQEIMKGFNESSVVVAVISKNSMNSVGLKNEIDHVYKKNKIIIPFIIDESEMSDDLSFYLSSTQWIMAGSSFTNHYDQLEKALSIHLK